MKLSCRRDSGRFPRLQKTRRQSPASFLGLCRSLKPEYFISNGRDTRCLNRRLLEMSGMACRTRNVLSDGFSPDDWRQNLATCGAVVHDIFVLVAAT